MSKHHRSYAVVGLGRFGMSIVQTLSELDVELMACDIDEHKLQRASEYATHVVQADARDESVLVKLGLGNYDVVIFAMGEDFETSLIATMIAKEDGAGLVIVKARSSRQRKILLSVGADEVILPEYEMGAKLARRLAGSNIRDILEDSEFYRIAEISPEIEWLGKTIRQADIRRKHGITVLATRRGGKLTIPVSPDKVLTKDDVLIILTEKHEHKM